MAKDSESGTLPSNSASAPLIHGLALGEPFFLSLFSHPRSWDDNIDLLFFLWRGLTNWWLERAPERLQNRHCTPTPPHPRLPALSPAAFLWLARLAREWEHKRGRGTNPTCLAYKETVNLTLGAGETGSSQPLLAWVSGNPTTRSIEQEPQKHRCPSPNCFSWLSSVCINTLAAQLLTLTI